MSLETRQHAADNTDHLYVYERILKECFWEYDFSVDDIKEMVTATESKKMFLFEKIFNNSSNVLLVLQIFDRDSLLKLLEAYRIPNIKKDFLAKRKEIVEYYFFDKELKNPFLLWNR